MRLPLARCEAAEELSGVLLRNSGLGAEFQAVLGLHSGAEAIDQALALALCAPRPGGALHPAPAGGGPPLMLVLLEGSFHGNCTRAAFSASAVFRAHPRREALCDFEAAYLAPDASAAQVEAAFARHDAGEAAVVAVVLEAQQHFARFAALQPRTAALTRRHSFHHGQRPNLSTLDRARAATMSALPLMRKSDEEISSDLRRVSEEKDEEVSTPAPSAAAIASNAVRGAGERARRGSSDGAARPSAASERRGLAVGAGSARPMAWGWGLGVRSHERRSERSNPTWRICQLFI